MKYVETIFDILYLIIAIGLGIIITLRAKNKTERFIGLSVLILGLGDAFHLIPRVLNYFSKADFTAALGIGKLVTSLTMTVFYVLLYAVWQGHYGVKAPKWLTALLCVLVGARFALCLMPQNGWLENKSDVLWGVIRNIPFVIQGAIIIVLYFKKRNDTKYFKRIWLWVTLSFLFYIPVAVAASLVPALGMLMLPKTVCYIAIILIFFRTVCVFHKGEAARSV